MRSKVVSFESPTRVHLLPCSFPLDLEPACTLYGRDPHVSFKRRQGRGGEVSSIILLVLGWLMAGMGRAGPVPLLRAR